MCRKVYYCIRKVIFEVKVAGTYLYAYLDLTRIQQKDKALSKNTPLRWEIVRRHSSTICSSTFTDLLA